MVYVASRANVRRSSFDIKPPRTCKYTLCRQCSSTPHGVFTVSDLENGGIKEHMR